MTQIAARPPSSAAQTAGRPDSAPTSAPLEALTGLLAAWNAASEDAYLAVGQDLQTIHDALRAVEGAMARTIALMTGPEIARIDERLAEAAALALALESNGEAIGTRIGDVLDGRRDAQHGRDQVARAFSLLDYVALVARTHIGASIECENPMTAFLDEVATLVEAGRAVTDRLSGRLAHLNASLEAAAVHLHDRKMEEARAKPLRAVIATLGEDLRARRVSADDNRHAARLAFARMAQSVARVVGVLQFHDIARQRLEHTIANLGHLARLTAGGGLGAEGPPDPRVRAAFIARIARLEAAQLADLAQLYQGRMAVIEASLGDVLVQARDGVGLVGALLLVDPSRAAGGPDLGIVRQAEELERRFLLRDMRRDAICASLAACVEATTQFASMTDALDDVEFSLRLAGFNAAIHAADQQGGDRTIGYIAHEIRDNATSAKTGADLIRTGIVAATRSAGELQSVLLPTEVQAATTIRQHFAGVLDAVQEAERHCLDQLSAAEAAAAGIPARVDGARAQMQRHLAGLTLMTRVRDLLGSLPEFGSDETGDVDYAPLARLILAGYTMKEERDVFFRVFGSAGTDPDGGDMAGAEPEAGAEEDLSDVFF